MIPDNSYIYHLADTIKAEYQKSYSWDNMEFGCKKPLGDRKIVVFAGQEIDSNQLAPLIKRIVVIFQTMKPSLVDLFSKVNSTEIKKIDSYKNLYFNSDSLIDNIHSVRKRIFNTLEISNGFVKDHPYDSLEKFHNEKIQAQIYSELDSLEILLENALIKGNFSLVESLLKRGADPFSVLYVNQGILTSSDFEKTKGFISAIPDINIQDEKGETLLHHAVLYPSIVLVDLLLNRGAKKNIANKEGKTPPDLIPEWDHAMRRLLT